MKLTRIVALLTVMLVCRIAIGDDSRVAFELSLANQKPSVPSSANWGWWNPSKYPDSWFPDETALFGIADARMLVSNRTYTAILAGEWYPTLEAVGTYDGQLDLVSSAGILAWQEHVFEHRGY